MGILAVNAGSSSLKFSLFPLVDSQVLPQTLSGRIEGLEPGGTPKLEWRWRGEVSSRDLQFGPGPVFAQALQGLRDLLGELDGDTTPVAVAHRVVHGGAQYRQSVVVDAKVLADLHVLISLAPLHQPHNLEGIRAFADIFEGVPQVACFDTAFHATLPEVDYRFPLPESLYVQGLRRYGFHGLSYQYVMGALPQYSGRAKGKVLMAHLGNGASLCGAVGGESRATTMGFSALDGLMMGTRTGSLDAGVMLYLMEQGWDHDRMQRLLYKESGLLGVSGSSADMRFLRSDQGDKARLAVEMFRYRVLREAGAMVACIQGIDVLTFSGGIGEHDVALRREVVRGLAWMGIEIDEERNQSVPRGAVTALHTPSSRVEVWVVPTDEEVVVAREAARLVCAG
ncbi:acetate/propionate family kinase [Candidatus Symbiobacter mobilis]|uniref:Acetate kinase n=1 Tax=Candidatus Symbiobacter mobilis CR TaxID=946483 RepID=U5N6U9_9BURK|nr:acetate/propionate family kinase [Candidatus Symbiobacter mobilis]AGX87010.1 acetate kinase [Candidatus Symbiobacter mobilis CR]